MALDVALIGFVVALVMLVLARLVMRKYLRTMEHLIGFASGVAREMCIRDSLGCFA